MSRPTATDPVVPRASARGRERLARRSLRLARERRVWLFAPPALRATDVDRVSQLELNLGEPALQISPAEAAELFSIVLGVR